METARLKLTKRHTDTLALTCAWFIKFCFLSLCCDVYVTTLLYTLIQRNILCPLHRLLHGEHQGTNTSKTELRAPAFLSIRHKSVRCVSISRIKYFYLSILNSRDISEIIDQQTSQFIRVALFFFFFSSSETATFRFDIIF